MSSKKEVVTGGLDDMDEIQYPVGMRPQFIINHPVSCDCNCCRLHLTGEDLYYLRKWDALEVRNWLLKGPFEHFAPNFYHADLTGRQFLALTKDRIFQLLNATRVPFNPQHVDAMMTVIGSFNKELKWMRDNYIIPDPAKDARAKKKSENTRPPSTSTNQSSTSTSTPSYPSSFESTHKRNMNASLDGEMVQTWLDHGYLQEHIGLSELSPTPGQEADVSQFVALFPYFPVLTHYGYKFTPTEKSSEAERNRGIIWFCAHCGFRINTSKKLIDHIASSHGTVPLMCLFGKCTYFSPFYPDENLKAWVSHCRAEHPDQQVQYPLPQPFKRSDSQSTSDPSIPTCGHCKKSGVNLKRCSRCSTVYYCDRECQRKDWKDHKSVCQLVCQANEINAARSSSSMITPSPTTSTGLSNQDYLYQFASKGYFFDVLDWKASLPEYITLVCAEYGYKLVNTLGLVPSDEFERGPKFICRCGKFESHDLEGHDLGEHIAMSHYHKPPLYCWNYNCPFQSNTIRDYVAHMTEKHFYKVSPNRILQKGLCGSDIIGPFFIGNPQNITCQLLLSKKSESDIYPIIISEALLILKQWVGGLDRHKATTISPTYLKFPDNLNYPSDLIVPAARQPSDSTVTSVYIRLGPKHPFGWYKLSQIPLLFQGPIQLLAMATIVTHEATTSTSTTQ